AVYEWAIASMNEGRGNAASGISLLLYLANLGGGEWLWLERILMGEVKAMQALPVFRIECIMPHLLQQRVKLGGGADGRGLRVSSRRTQIRNNNRPYPR